MERELDPRPVSACPRAHVPAGRETDFRFSVGHVMDIGVRSMDARRLLRGLCVSVLSMAIGSATAVASTIQRLCDPSFQNCRTELLTLIDNEHVGLDVAFWFMEDQRYVSRIIARWKAGVPVRVIVDPRANATYPLNTTSLDALRSAGIPMRYKRTGGIMHWKTMVFAGQHVVE